MTALSTPCTDTDTGGDGPPDDTAPSGTLVGEDGDAGSWRTSVADGGARASDGGRGKLCTSLTKSVRDGRRRSTRPRGSCGGSMGDVVEVRERFGDCVAVVVVVVVGEVMVGEVSLRPAWACDSVGVK